MKRRLMTLALACWPAARLLAQDAPSSPMPRQKISARELHAELASHFPVRFGVPGVFVLRVAAPRLLLRPSRQQIGATLALDVRGAQLPQPYAGEMDIVFALRYESADQTIRAHDLQILALRCPGLPTDSAQMLQAVLPELAREAIGEVVLHRFTPAELALPDTMGFAPESITVLDDGLLISFGPKARP